MNSKTIKIIILALLGFFLSMPSHAFENILFLSELTPRESYLLTKYNHDVLHMDYHALKIARADLNTDGLYEYIIKTPECGKEPPTCLHVVIAETGREVLEIGRFKTRSLVLGASYHSGVRNLLSFEHPGNDFMYDIYQWDSRRSAYKLSGTGAKQEE